MKASDAYKITTDAKFGRSHTLPGGVISAKAKKKKSQSQGTANSVIGEGSEVTGSIGANAGSGAAVSKYGAGAGVAVGGGLFF
jgi:hypothetical protein